MRLNLIKTLFLIISIFSAFKSIGQSFPQNPTDIEVIYTNPTGVNLCSPGNQFSIEIKNPSDANSIDAGTIITYTLPAGIEFESLISGSATPGGSGQNPTFKLLNAIPPGGSEEIEFSTSVNCETFQFIENNSLSSLANGITVDYSVDGSEKSIARDAVQLANYNLAVTRPVISLPATNRDGEVNHPQIFNSSNERITQRVEVELEGNQNLESFFIEIDLPENILPLKLNSQYGIDVTVCNINSSAGPNINAPLNLIEENGILRLEINSADFGGRPGGFLPNDWFRIDFCFRTECSIGEPQIINYNTAVECFGDPCAITFAEGSFVQDPVFADLLTMSQISGDGDLCGETTTYTMNLTNNGDGAAFDVIIYGILPSHLPVTYSNFTIDGQPAPGLENAFNNNTNGAIEFTISDFEGLFDVNGDGVSGEIPPGQTVVIQWDIAHDFDGGACGFQFNSRLAPRIIYRRNECRTNRIFSNTSGDTRSIWEHKSDFAINTPGCSELTLEDESQENQTVRFCSTIKHRDGFDILSDEFTFFTNVTIPCGYELTEGAQVTLDVGDITSQLNMTVINERSFRFDTEQFFEINSHPTNLRSMDVCFNIPISNNCEDDCLTDQCGVNCREGRDNCGPLTGGDFMVSGFAVPRDCPNTRLGIGCADETIAPPCDVLNCPADGLADITTEEFEMTRATFGWIPGTNNQQRYTYQQVLDGTIPNDVNLRGAYACDEVVATLNGNVRCGSTNGVIASIEYNVPTAYGRDFLQYIQAEFIINGVTVPATSNEADLVSGIASHSIRLDNFTLNSGDIVEANIRLRVNADVNEHTDFINGGLPPNIFPNVHDFGLTGQLRTIEDRSRCPVCTSFEVYSIDSWERIIENRVDFRCGAPTQLSHRFQFRGGSNDDFPNEIRPFFNLTDYSIEVLDPSLAGSLGLNNSQISLSINGGNANGLETNQNGSEITVADGEIPFRDDKTETQIWYEFRIGFQPDCDFPTTNSLFESTISHHRNLYAQNLGCDVQSADGRNVNFRSLNVASYSYVPLDNHVQAITNEVNFSGQLQRPSSQNFSFPWIRVTFPPDLIRVSNGANRPYILTDGANPIYNTDGDQLFLALDRIEAIVPFIGQLDVELLECSENQTVEIKIETGQSCIPITQNPFEEDIQGQLCPVDEDIVTLELLKTNIELNVFPYFEQAEAQEFCEELCFMTQSFNDEKGNLFNPFFNFDIPEGMDITSFRYRHPLTTDQLILGDNMPASFDFSGFITVDPNELNDNTPWSMLHSNGNQLDFLSGTISDPDDNLNTLDNYYQAEVCFLPNCEYNFSEAVVIAVGGENSCEEEINQDFKIKPRFEGAEGLENYNPSLTLTNTPENGCGKNKVTLTYENDFDISSFIKEGDVIEVKYMSILGPRTVSIPLNGNVGTYTYEFEITADLCQEVWVEAEIKIDVVIECNDEECDGDYSFSSDRLEIPFRKGDVIMDLNLIDDACEYNTSNASLTLTNTGEIDLTDVEVFIYCDANQDGSIISDDIITSVTIPLVQADQAPWSFNDNYWYNGRFGMISVNKHNLQVGDVVYINQDPGFTHAGYNGQHTIKEVISEYIVITDQGWLGNTPAESGIVYKENTVTQIFDIPDLRSCGSGQIIAYLDPTEICNCGLPLSDIENYTCCDLLDIKMHTSIDCEGNLSVKFEGDDIEVLSTPLDLNVSGVGTFTITQLMVDVSNPKFTLPVQFDLDPQEATDYTITVEVPRQECKNIPQTISSQESWEPYDLYIQSRIGENVCDLSVAQWVILPPEGINLTNIVWTFDTEGDQIVLQNGGLIESYRFGEEGEYKTCVTAEDQDGCKYNDCSEEEITRTTASMDITHIPPKKCYDEWVFKLSSEDAPKNLTWLITDLAESVTYESRYVDGYVMEQSFQFTEGGSYKITVSGVARDGSCPVSAVEIIHIDECCLDPISLEATVSCSGKIEVEIIGSIKSTDELTINWGNGTFSSGIGTNSFSKELSPNEFGSYHIEVELKRGPNCDIIKASDDVTWESTGKIDFQKFQHDNCNQSEFIFQWRPINGQELHNFTWTPNKDEGGQALTDNSEQITHDFVSEGDHIMYLTAEDDEGCLYFEKKPVEISDPVPIMELNITEGNCTEPWAFTLSPISADNIGQVQWTLTNPDNTQEAPAGNTTQWTTNDLAPGKYTLSASAIATRGGASCPFNFVDKEFTVVPQCCDEFDNSINGVFQDCQGAFTLTINGLLREWHTVTIDWGDPDDPAQTISTNGANVFNHTYQDPYVPHLVTVTINRGEECPNQNIPQTFALVPRVLQIHGMTPDWCEPDIRDISIVNIPANVTLSNINWTSEGTITGTRNNNLISTIEFGGLGSYNTSVTAIDQDHCEYDGSRTDNVNTPSAAIEVSVTEGDCETNTPWVFNTISSDAPRDLQWTATRNTQTFELSSNTGSSISQVFDISGVYNVCVSGVSRGVYNCPVSDCELIEVGCCNVEGDFDLKLDKFCSDVPNGNNIIISNVTTTPNVPESQVTFRVLDNDGNQVGPLYNHIPQWIVAPSEPGTYYIEMKTFIDDDCEDYHTEEFVVECCNAKVDFTIPKDEFCTFGEENVWPGYIEITDMVSSPADAWAAATIEITRGSDVIVPAQIVNNSNSRKFYFNGTEGVYKVTMKVEAGNWCEDEEEKTFEIKKCPCTNEIDVTLDINCKSQGKLSIAGDFNGANVLFDVDWGDGNSNNNVSFWHLNYVENDYKNQEGKFCATATLIDPNCPATDTDCDDFELNTITIVPNQIGCNDEDVTFTIQEDANVHSVKWYVGGELRNVGGSKTLFERFTTSGIHTVSVEATDYNGCPVIGEAEVTVGAETCDPNLKANAVIDNYNSETRFYTIDMTGSVGDVDYYYYSIDGGISWRVSTSGIFQISDDCGSNICVKVGNSVCEDPIKPFNDMCESPVECLNLTPEN